MKERRRTDEGLTDETLTDGSEVGRGGRYRGGAADWQEASVTDWEMEVSLTTPTDAGGGGWKRGLEPVSQAMTDVNGSDSHSADGGGGFGGIASREAWWETASEG